MRKVKLEGRILTDGLLFPEGPIAMNDGSVIVVEIEGGRLIRVAPDWARAAASLYVVYPSAKHVPKKVIAFRDFVLETFQQLGSRTVTPVRGRA